jgi:ABC-type glutathione transport system ATPase component
MNSLVELKDLGVDFVDRGTFGGTRGLMTAVDGISLTMGAGEIVALVGASGSGKTTTVRVALGLQEPTRGAARFRGKDIGSLKPSEQREMRRRVQMIFQDPTEALNPRMTVEQIINEGLAIHRIGHDRPSRRVAVIEALGFVGLLPAEEFLGRYPHMLSGGQRQRVAIAAALALSPDLLVADEPVSMLDPSIRADILNLFARLRTERGMSTLMVTHDLPSAYQLADRIYVMNRGRIVEEGSPRDVLRAPQDAYTRTLVAAASGRPVGVLHHA